MADQTKDSFWTIVNLIPKQLNLGPGFFGGGATFNPKKDSGILTSFKVTGRNQLVCMEAGDNR